MKKKSSAPNKLFFLAKWNSSCYSIVEQWNQICLSEIFIRIKYFQRSLISDVSIKIIVWIINHNCTKGTETYKFVYKKKNKKFYFENLHIYHAHQFYFLGYKIVELLVFIINATVHINEMKIN